MRPVLTSLILALLALPAWAQTQQQSDWCSSPHASDDQKVAGCTARIQLGREAAATLAADYNNRGAAYTAKRLYDQAIADGTHAITFEPDYAQAYNNRGNAYAGKGLYDRAIADYSQAIALNPDYARAYFNRGAVYSGKGLRDRAIADYRAALAGEPGMTKANEALIQLGATP
ncbi:MAG: peptidase caspase catalytic subunit p20 [Caulobacteraceae bacterium]|nr:peptidase caspase catalytic subunit p20 [Caulobacteraceae bacterium]